MELTGLLLLRNNYKEVNKHKKYLLIIYIKTKLIPRHNLMLKSKCEHVFSHTFTLLIKPIQPKNSIRFCNLFSYPLLIRNLYNSIFKWI